MKLLLFHDAKGNIARIVVPPPNAPAGAVSASAGHFVTEIDDPDVKIDPAEPASYQRLTHVLENFLVEAKTEGKLVKKARPVAG